MKKGSSKSGNAWVRPYRGDKFRVYFRVDGKLHGSKTYDTSEDAERAAEIIRREITTRTRTVADAIDAYERDLEERELSQPEQHARRLRVLMASALESPLTALNHHRCKELYRMVVTAGDWQPGTHHRVLERAKTWGLWCAHKDRGWIKVSPWSDVEPIGKRPDHRDDVLRNDDARLWLAEAFKLAHKRDTGAVAALIALVMNLRPGEIVQIEARDVDDNGRVLWVAGDRLKTHTSRRQIEVPDVLRPILLKLKDGKEPTDRIIPHEKDYVREASKWICERAGVPPIDARGLRRSHATLQARRGVALEDIGDSMGHADRGKTAQRHYVNPDALASAGAEKVAGLLTDGKGR